MVRLFTSLLVIAPSPLIRRLELIDRAGHADEDLLPGFPIGIEGFALASVPLGAQLGRVNLPIRANPACDRAEILVQLTRRRPSPIPVAVVNLVDLQTWLQHECVRYHRIVVWISILLNVEILLDEALFVVEEWPVGTHAEA